jgi:hypothetical protein
MLTPGDAWTVRYTGGIRATRTFLRVQADGLVFETSQAWPDGSVSQGFLHTTRDLSTVGILAADGTEQQRFTPHSLGLQFPLIVGKRWEGRCQRFDEGRPAGEFVGAYAVVGVESVAVPAGVYQAFRVEGRTHDPQAPTRQWRFTHWYAPDVGMEVKHQAVEPDGRYTEYELVEFRPAAAARTPGSAGSESFLGVWEGHWKEMLLATTLTVERISGDVASLVYWRGAFIFPGLQKPHQQRALGRFSSETTLQVELWDDANQRWAEAVFDLNPDGTLSGTWKSGGVIAHAILRKYP